MYAFVLLFALSATPDSPAARATELFNVGRAAMKANQFATACPAFAESHRLDPALGTLLNLADCYERLGKLSAAWVHFNEAAGWAARTHEADREALAKERSQKLKKQLGWLTLSADDVSEALVDGIPTPVTTQPISLPVDPGTHRVEVPATATNGAWQTLVSLKVDGSARITIPPLAVQATPPLAEVRPPEPAVVPNSAPSPTKPPAAPRTTLAGVATRRTAPSQAAPLVGYALLTTGAVLAVAGTIGLAWSLSTYGRLQDQKLATLNDAVVTLGEFRTLQWLYPASWVCAGVGLAAALSGIFTAALASGAAGQPRVSVAPMISATSQGVSIGASW
jgi:tetratricopeptide (TPR) repeat protein